MNIDELTIGEARQLASLFQAQAAPALPTLNRMIGKKVIVRTHNAGVWFGTLTEKSGNEVILKGARRMWRWCSAESISLSGVAVYGINPDKSKITPAVEQVWLQAIEIIPCTREAIASIEGAQDVDAE